MAQETQRRQRTIDEAVRDGLLVDVTEIAKRAGMRYQTFMSPSLIARYNAKGPNELYAILEVYESYIKFLNGYDSYGAARYDAAYLELAMRRGCPLATAENKLSAVAEVVGVPLLQHTNFKTFLSDGESLEGVDLSRP
jgi:hypothetical protein